MAQHLTPRPHALPRKPIGLAAAALAVSLTLGSAAAADPNAVTVTGRRLSLPAAIGGFGDTPPSRLPLSVNLIDEAQLRDGGARTLADITRLEAGLTDAYNTEGYWSYLTVRGFTLDNRSNFRRDGLPINAETALALDAISRVEVLRGTSGIQAGTSAPGGLVNLIVKRPDGTRRSLEVGWRDGGSLGISADLGTRFGEAESFGVRLNLGAESLRPQTRDADGRRHHAALAFEWRLSPATRLEVEAESARQSQPSVPGFSLLGDVLPDARSIDPRLNLNNQPWSQPVVLDSRVASVRWTQQLSATTSLQAHLMRQQLRNDDRIAFPYGVFDPATYECNPCDRYGPDGRFSLWDFRSENERRRTDAADVHLSGTAIGLGSTHRWTVGVLTSRHEARFQNQAYNLVGLASIDGRTALPSDPTPYDPNTDRDERSTEWYARDAVELAPGWQVWGGVRHTQLERASIRTDGSRATRYEQNATLPFVALSHQISDAVMAYASIGQGLETEVVPNRSVYLNRGQPLPALKSRQREVGLKWQAPLAGVSTDGALTVFDIRRPQTADVGACNGAATCTRTLDGDAHHRGLEAQWRVRGGGWTLNTAGLWLRATREGSATAELNGLAPTNVPQRNLRFQLEREVSSIAGLSLWAAAQHDAGRQVLPDNSVGLPAWTRTDAGLRWVVRTPSALLTWRAGIDNLTDRRAWREAPYQFGHAYLFPLQPRSARVSLQAEL